MTVYIDVLFIINLVVNYFILLAVSSLLHRQDKRLRILLGAIFGAFYSVFMFFPQVQFLYSAVLKLLASIAIVLISYRGRSIKMYIKLLLYFFLISMLFGGVMYAVQYFAAPPMLSVRNGVAYMSISPLFLIITSAVCYALIHLISRFFHRDVHTNDIYEIEIAVGGVIAKMHALLDNGNDLYDTLSGTPVIIVEYSKIEKLIPEPLRISFKTGKMADADVLESTGFSKRFRVIPYGSVGSIGGILPAFRPDTLFIKNSGKTYSDVLTGVTNRRLSDDGKFYALLNPRLFGENSDSLPHDKNIKAGVI